MRLSFRFCLRDRRWPWPPSFGVEAPSLLKTVFYDLREDHVDRIAKGKSQLRTDGRKPQHEMQDWVKCCVGVWQLPDSPGGIRHFRGRTERRRSPEVSSSMSNCLRLGLLSLLGTGMKSQTVTACLLCSQEASERGVASLEERGAQNS